MRAIGERLRTARQARGLTIQQAVSATRIKAKYLTALEEGDLDAFLSPVQLRGFLRNYAVYLRLDADDLLASFDAALRLRRAEAAPPESPTAEGEAAPRLPAALPPGAEIEPAARTEPAAPAAARRRAEPGPDLQSDRQV